MAEPESIIGLILTGMGILLTLIIPLPLKEEYRLFIIASIIFAVLVVLLSRFGKRLEEMEKNAFETNKRFKTIESLNDIRLDIRELKRSVFKDE